LRLFSLFPRPLPWSLSSGSFLLIYNLCSTPSSPKLTLSRDGELKEYLASGVSKEEFLRRIGVAFQSAVPETPARIAAASRTSALAGDSSNPTATRQPPSQTAPLTPAPNNSQSTSNKSGQSKEQKITSNGKGKGTEQPITSKLPPESIQKKAVETKYALQRKKEQKDAKSERERILARVEADKAARRRESELRTEARTRAAASNEATDTLSVGEPVKKPLHAECAVQVRLFDGSSIRQRFSSSNSLRADVRPWVDSKQELESPYNFKLVLTPMPNRDISLSEEEQDLQSLGLTPSATLILVPVTEFTSAYEGGGSMALLYRGASAGYGLLAGGVSWIASAVGGVLGHPVLNESPREVIENPDPAPTPRSARINIRTLQDQQPREGQQFYNGNAV
jgi:hypothetical protein